MAEARGILGDGLVAEVLAPLAAFGVPLVPSPSQLQLLLTRASELLYAGPSLRPPPR